MQMMAYVPLVFSILWLIVLSFLCCLTTFNLVRRGKISVQSLRDPSSRESLRQTLKPGLAKGAMAVRSSIVPAPDDESDGNDDNDDAQQTRTMRTTRTRSKTRRMAQRLTAQRLPVTH
jgi:hypothetical protein